MSSPSTGLVRLIPDHNVERHYCAYMFPRKIGHARRHMVAASAFANSIEFDKLACFLEIWT